MRFILFHRCGRAPPHWLTRHLAPPHGPCWTCVERYVIILYGTLPNRGAGAARARRKRFRRHRVSDEGVDRIQGQGRSHQSQELWSSKQYQAENQREWGLYQKEMTLDLASNGWSMLRLACNRRDDSRAARGNAVCCIQLTVVVRYY